MLNFFTKASISLFFITTLCNSHLEARKSAGNHRVKSHINKNGSYIPSHRRTNPRTYKPRNNWSSSGNINPYTGKKGYKSRTR